ncbi:box C/D snoRNA protein 1 [Sorex fumeus]|uniref:box C/D snoRNA protein 1 n=1 Tax=Sorex fumeus TaxID=62283 RepID=UPI0024AC84FD|nr:box C/D snoRNA protein 1 [Sorex fumeus]
MAGAPSPDQRAGRGRGREERFRGAAPRKSAGVTVGVVSNQLSPPTGPDHRGAVKSTCVVKAARRGSVALRPRGSLATGTRRSPAETSAPARGALSVLWEVHSFIHSCRLKNSWAPESQSGEGMDLVAENEGTPGGAVSAGAEGAPPSPRPVGEGVGHAAGMELAGGMQATGDGEEGGGPGAEAMRGGVKREVRDWPEMEAGPLGGQGVTPEGMEEKPGAWEARRERSVVVREEKAGQLEVPAAKVTAEEEAGGWRAAELDERKEKLEMKPEELSAGRDAEGQQRRGTCVEAQLALPEEEAVRDATAKAVGAKRKLAMSRCETCGTEEAKYRCPRCMRYSCSLPCVKKHKAELTCNGIRDKTAYVSIQQFTEMNLLSDYRFLEDVARTADHISRDAFLKRPISNKHMYFLKNRARKQGINLKLLPNGFTKRKENSTFFDKKKQQFCWHLKLQFPQSQAVYIEKRVPDDKTIKEILRPYIDPEKSDPVIRQRLKAYIRSQTAVQILMKVEYMQQNLVRYYELDPYKSLLDNLRNKVIIEYPTLHVVLKEFSNDMKILHQGKSESVRNITNEK